MRHPWLNEPLVHFVAAGLVLFAVSKLHSDEGGAHMIVITPKLEGRVSGKRNRLSDGYRGCAVEDIGRCEHIGLDEGRGFNRTVASIL